MMKTKRLNKQHERVTKVEQVPNFALHGSGLSVINEMNEDDLSHVSDPRFAAVW